MRIAQCLEYPLGLRGGVSVIVENLAAELALRGHKIVLVSPDSTEALQGGTARQWIEQHISWNNGDPSISNARRLAEQLASAGVDIAHFHAGGNYGWGNRFPFCSPVYYARKRRIPIVWTTHRAETILAGYCGPKKPLLFKLLLFPIAWLGKMQQVRCSRFEIAVSRDNFDKLRRWYAPLASRFVQIYHSRLREDEVAGESVAKEPIILNVGHLAEAKGQAVLVGAFARIAKRYPNFKLQLAGYNGGDGTLERINELIKEGGLEKQVFWLGERTDTLTLMQRASIYVQPSLAEALGLALQEAMYCGCAAVGTRVGGIPELIRDGETGLLVEPTDRDSLAAALESLISNPERCEHLAKAGKASIRVRAMTAEKMAERYTQLYDSVRS